jgi:hypothetical protein
MTNNTNTPSADEARVAKHAYDSVANFIEDFALNYELPPSARINQIDKEIASLKRLLNDTDPSSPHVAVATGARLRAFEQIKNLMTAASVLS